MPTIRPAVPADAAAVVTLRATVFPYLVRGPAATNRMIASPPPGEDWAAFVATDADRVVGWVAACRDVRAAADGATVAYAANDESNRPMLTVNEQLGYRPVATQFSCVTTIKG
jgi:hypothetical protein